MKNLMEKDILSLENIARELRMTCLRIIRR
jgi:hypothetical protein